MRGPVIEMEERARTSSDYVLVEMSIDGRRIGSTAIRARDWYAFEQGHGSLAVLKKVGRR